MSEKLDLEIEDLPEELTGMAREIAAADSAEETAAPKTAKRSAEPKKSARAEKPAKKERNGKTAKAAAAAKEQKPAKKLPLRINQILLGCFAICLIWGLFNLHPYASTAEKTENTGSVSTGQVVETTKVVESKPASDTEDAEETSEDGTETGESAEGENTGEAEEEEPQVETVASMHYTISHDATYGETPDSDCYGTVSIDTPEEMEAVIQEARDIGLLGEDETVVFDPDADFNNWEYVKDIEYYLDDTIFVICWKEMVDNYVCSFSEVKIADASQLRRKLVGDSYGTQATQYLSDLAAETNAVVAFNADFYAFRDFGIMGYQDTLYQYSDATFLGELKMYNCLDNMFVTHSGDFIFAPQGTVFTEEELQQFMTDNDVCFTVSFGPILVEDGELNESYWSNYYPVGETDSIYCRTGLGQVGELHYLYMSLNDSDKISGVGWTVKQFAEKMAERGVINAYCMDGGQTSEIYFNGDVYNHVVYGTERAVSDMIYFATALPSDGGEG